MERSVRPFLKLFQAADSSSHSAALGVYDPRIDPLEAMAVRYGKPHGQGAKRKVRMDEEKEKSRIGKPRG